MKVAFLAPAYPAEMPDFVRGLAEVGAKVYGIGDAPVSALPAKTRAALHDYLQVPRLMDEAHLIATAGPWLKQNGVEKVEALWEPLVIAAARLREHLGLPGMSVDTVLGFRDKQLMKERIQQAGLRVPYSFKVRSEEQAWEAAEKVGFPLIIKPIAGAGSADTYRVDGPDDLRRVLAATRHVPVVSVEEFVEGEEFTYDTVCIDGRPVYENVAQYLPRPLEARTHEWISPVICTVANLNQPAVRGGIELGRGVLKALGMGTGFTHMEWYRKANGEVVFGEIGCRPGGARLVDQMNFSSDIDLYREWARAVVHGHVRIDQPRRFNTAIIFKRAKGQGTIRLIDGYKRFMSEYGQHVLVDELLKPGQRRRNWKQTLVSDGYIILRHTDWNAALELAGRFAKDVTIYAS